MSRRSYSLKLVVNGIYFSEVIIDQHYRQKHAASMSDFIILNLVRKLNGRLFRPFASDSRFKYFRHDPLELSGKNYRLIWIIPAEEDFIGVVNAHRRK